MIKDYFRLAYRSAVKRKLRSWLTMIGIFIGIAAVVALISLSQGLQTAIAEQFVSLGSDKLLISAAGSSLGPPGTAVSKPLTIDDEKIIEKVNGVDLVVGRLLRLAKLEFKDEVKYSYIASVPQESQKIALLVEANNYKIDQGRFITSIDMFKTVIGHDFADNFFGHQLELRDKIKIQDQLFTVVGILKKSGNPQQDSALVIPESAFREILDVNDEYDLIPVKVVPGEDLSLITENIKKKLRQFRNVDEGEEDFSVQTPESLLATLNNILGIVQGILVGIAGISLLVGGIGIMNTMYTAVVERTKEIGIMKATGARNKQVLFLFMVESGMLGFFGGLIGIILGYSISKSVEYIAYQIYESFLIKANFSLPLMLGALLFAFVVGALSGVLPARQAANLKPVDALRK